MAAIDLEVAGRYIDALPLVEVVRGEGGPTAAGPAGPPLSEGKAQASIVDSNIITFPESTPLEVRNAVANWTLMAQMAASKAVSDREAVREWMEVYTNVLLKSGWTVREDEGSQTREALYGSTMYEKILALVAVALGPVPTALAIVTAALQSLQSMNKNSPWITLFDRRGKSARSVGFQIANCETDNSGTAALRGTEFIVEAHQTLTQVLFFKFTSHEASLYRRARTLTLSARALEQLSPKVEERVLDMVSDNILAFDLEHV
jgi:hypothetical protein